MAFSVGVLINRIHCTYNIVRITRNLKLAKAVSNGSISEPTVLIYSLIKFKFQKSPIRVWAACG